MLIIRACCVSVLCLFFFFSMTSVDFINGIEGIGRFSMYTTAIVRLLVLSPNLLSASIKIIYDLWLTKTIHAVAK